MRSLTLTLLFVLITAALTAQIRKGDRILTPYNNSPITLVSAPPAVASNVGGLFLITEGEGAVLTVLPQYGFAVSNRMVIGASVIVGLSVGGGSGEVSAGITPYARYYFVNKPKLLAYGGLRAGVALADNDAFIDAASLVQPHLGVGLPLADGILFAPELGYTFAERRNSVSFTLGFDFILGKNNRPEQRVTGRYGRGAWMFGTQLGGAGIGQRFTTLRIAPEAYYFLGRRFALGVTAGTSLTRFNFNLTQLRVNSTHIGLASRYFPVQGRHFDLFTHAGFQLEFDDSRIGLSTGDPFVDNTVVMDGGLGGMLFLRQRVALELGLNLRIYPQNEFAEMGINTGIRFFLGGRAGAK